MISSISVVYVSDKKPTLKEAQVLVGGYVEVVNLQNGDQMLVNEEGFLKDYPVNTEASALAGRMIVGPVMVLSGKAKWKG
jgi:hypothetical protein